ncbi:MAG: glycosyltransferase, partial [Bryobacteraceae bacterium]
PMHRLIRLFHSTEVRLLRRFWESDPPDMVVSLIPQFNRAMFEAFQSVRAGAPYVTIITDFADYPPHFWLEPLPQHVIAGTEKARDQALEMGFRPETVHLVSGMILRPQFYQSQEVDRAAERARLGLKPDVRTGLVLFGGFGSPQMTQIVRKLQPLAGSLQLILMCGRNEKLARRLRALRSRVPLHVEGFTQEIPYFMRLADFFIGKPGPGSISEAIAIGLPVIVECNDWTMPQERYNADWVGSRDVGVVVRSFRDILPAVDRLLEQGTLRRLRANAMAIHNRAVFEIADILAGL